MSCIKRFQLSRPTSSFPLASRSTRFSTPRNLSRKQLVVVFSEPSPEQISAAIEEAKETCETGTTEECATSWDVVEEISAAAADKKVEAEANKDPLEAYCQDNPETDECRVYQE
eukprot:TRINITY_DN1580_c0_g1_i3.p3 TRINITY_DN1580_c0_g1~~TRINITY_DN1580_c0_g1_i3.p3  ORF type:complete len:127 (-),score=28.34 TRINITY_DN1580_c0_g1_i3:240-581(-)